MNIDSRIANVIEIQDTLSGQVETAFNRALADPDIRRWHSVSTMARLAAFQLAKSGDHYLAACMEGVAGEAQRQIQGMMPK